MSTPLAQHSSQSVLWYTPLPILTRVRNVLDGTIDLDPASDAFGNSRVQATQFYTEAMNGLSLPWTGRIFCNPPGGKIGKGSRMKMFWNKLMIARQTQKFGDAIFLAFTLEALATTQTPSENNPHGLSLCDFTVCIPRKRIRFIRPDGVTQKQPVHANAIAYVPGRWDVTEHFVRTFSSLGTCMRGFYQPSELLD